MSNALTLSDMSPGLQEVVGREVATSHINGRAGWWKSPCPDLARGRDGQPPGLLYNGLFHRPRRPSPLPRPRAAAGSSRPARPGTDRPEAKPDAMSAAA